jgi:hypothetical protein
VQLALQPGPAKLVPRRETVEQANIRRSNREQKAFLQGSAAKGWYFAYVSLPHPPPYMLPHISRGEIVTFMGAVLATVTWWGKEFKDNLGGTRQAFRAHGVDQHQYFGWTYPSAGTYVRMRRTKHWRKP